MRKYKKISARILSFALTVAMIMSMLPITVLAAEAATPSNDATIVSFDKLEDRFIPSTGKDAPQHIYALSVPQGTKAEEILLPTVLSSTVQRTSVVAVANTENATATAGAPTSQIQTVLANEKVAITWKSDKAFTGDANDKFVYTAALPEGFVLADGVQLPQIYVAVGRQARAAGDTEIIVGGENATAGYEDGDGAALQKAFNEIANEGTIYLGKGLSFGMGLTVAADKKFTLNLNGKILQTMNEAIIVLGDITIDDSDEQGEIQNGIDNSIFKMKNAGSLTLNNGNLYSMNDAYIIDMTDTSNTGSLTINGGTIFGEYRTISTKSTGNTTINGGTISSNSTTLTNDGPGNIIMTGGTISSDGSVSSRAIQNSGTGTLTISGGTVSATAGPAIYSQSMPVTISGADTKITSANISTTGGTIFFAEPPAIPTILLNVEGGTVENTASPLKNAVYFSGSNVTVDNYTSYFTKADGATVGKVFPSPSTEIVVGGADATAGYETADKATLQKAFDNIINEGTIYLGDNITFTGLVTAPADKEYILDLNGKIIDVDESIFYTKGALTVKDSGTNGEIKSTKQTVTLSVKDNGSLTLNSGKISTVVGMALASYESGAITVKGGSVEATSDIIAGRTLDGKAIHCKDGALTISGGTVSSTTGIAIENGGTGVITISGDDTLVTSSRTDTQSGTITLEAIPDPKSVILNILGGTVSNTAATGKLAVYFEDESVTADNVTDYFTKASTATVGKVYPAPLTDITIGGTDPTPGFATANTETLQKAFDKIITNGTITLGDDITLMETGITTPADKKYTLDLNGKTIDVKTLTITTNGDLIIKDSDINGEMMSSEDNTVIILVDTEGSVTVDSGKITGTNLGAILSGGAGDITINGGTISSTTSATVANMTGDTTVSGGTISATTGVAISNFSGALTISGGTVSATTGKAINSTTGLVSISGASTKITSACTDTEFGTITIYGISTPASTMLNIADATVENTAGIDKYAIRFNNAGIKSAHLFSYYTKSSGTVGTIFPAEPIANITVGGVEPTKGFEGADTVTLQKAFDTVANDGTVMLGAHITIDDNEQIVAPETVAFTFNLAGYKLTVPAVGILIDGAMTVTQGMSRGEIMAKSADGTVLAVSETGSLELKSGKISSTAGIAITNAGTVTTSGGEISTTTGIAISNVDAGTITMAEGEILSTSGTGIEHNGTGLVTIGKDFISAAKVSTETGKAINVTSTSGVTLNGGTISATTGHAINILGAATGAINLNGGKVSATTGEAIYSGGTSVITINGTTITSANASPTSGTIYISKFFEPADMKVLLEYKRGAIENTASAESYTIYFSDEKVTSNTVAGYLTYPSSANLGNVHPAIPLAHITIGGDAATPGYKTSDTATFQRALNTIADKGKIVVVGNLTLDDVQVATPKDKAFTLDLFDSTIEVSLYGIEVNCDMTITSALNSEIKAKGETGSVFNVSETGSLTVKAGTIFASKNTGIYNNGIVIIDGGAVSTNEGYAINNVAGTVTVKSGTVSSATGKAIENNGDKNIEISGGKVFTTSGIAIYNKKGNVAISGGTVSATTGAALKNSDVGGVTITGGTISATTGNAILSTNNGLTVINGDGALVTSANITDGTINITRALATPKVLLSIQKGKVENTAGMDKYSVYFSNPYVTSDTVASYFTQASTATVGNIFPVPAEPIGDITIGGANATRGYDKLDANTLMEAFKNITTDHKIIIGTDGTLEVLANVGLGVDKDKDIMLDLNGKKVEFSGLGIIINGKLTITDSANIGEIKSNSPLSSIFVVNKDATLTISGGKISADSAITSEGKVLISGGSIVSTAASSTGNLISSKGNVTLSGGTITTNANNAIKLENIASMTMTGGTITTISGMGIWHMSTASMIMTGGTISTSSGVGIRNIKTGNVNIFGGKIIAVTGNAIYNYGFGVITINGDNVLISSANVKDGTIYFMKHPDVAKVLISVKAGKVENTAGADKYSLYFGDDATTVANVPALYNIEQGASVGRIFPSSGTPVVPPVTPPTTPDSPAKANPQTGVRLG